MDKVEVKIKKDLNDFIRKVAKKIKIEKVMLFGSRARGDAGASSDIDLIIISEDFYGKRSFERPVGLYRLWWNRADKKEIDIICLTPEEFEIMKKRIGAIRDAAREGIEI